MFNVIDPLAAFLPGRSENNAGCMLEALLPLQRLSARGLSTWILHHPSKGDPPPGQAARGSGALSGYADILLEMRSCPDAEDDDRRRLLAFSRFPETPRQRVIDLSADGADYLSGGTIQEEEFAGHWQVLQGLLAAAEAKWTRSEIHQRWPAEKSPDPVSVIRWLERAVALGLLRKDGRGLRNHPFRYWLPEREAFWRKDPLACILRPELSDPGASPPDYFAPAWESSPSLRGRLLSIIDRYLAEGYNAGESMPPKMFR